MDRGSARRPDWRACCGGVAMGRFVVGLLIGLAVGLIFAENIFPDGFSNAVEHWAEQVRNQMPGH